MRNDMRWQRKWGRRAAERKKINRPWYVFEADLTSLLRYIRRYIS